MLRGLQQADKASPSAMELEPTLTMLDGLYEQSKKRIVELNKKEDKSKLAYKGRESEHESRLAQIESEFKQHDQVPEAMRASDLQEESHLLDEENFFQAYWKRVRERNHKQYHTFLRIQHGMMDRAKQMKDMYEQALSSEQAGSSSQQPPDVALLQGAQHFAMKFVHASLADVEELGNELNHWD
jgi:hypothetical protein